LKTIHSSKARPKGELRTTPQVGIAAWYPKNIKKFSALRAGSDNTAYWNSIPKPQVGGEYPVKSD